jgi:hypothetical protein
VGMCLPIDSKPLDKVRGTHGKSATFAALGSVLRSSDKVMDDAPNKH